MLAENAPDWSRPFTIGPATDVSHVTVLGLNLVTTWLLEFFRTTAIAVKSNCVLGVTELDMLVLPTHRYVPDMLALTNAVVAREVSLSFSDAVGPIGFPVSTVLTSCAFT